MLFPETSSTIAILLGAAGISLYFLYRKGLPKPLPGIPHDMAAAKRFSGDLASLDKEMKGRGDFAQWMTDHHLKTGSPISQVFLRPFWKPQVVISDYWEIRDMLVNRTKDFDRDFNFDEMFSPLMPTAQAVLKTGPDWKKRRGLMQDLMAPKFLQEVAAPCVYEAAVEFAQLWKAKANLAPGQPFEAHDDVFHANVNASLRYLFGINFPLHTIESAKDRISNVSIKNHGSITDSPNKPVQFTKIELDPRVNAMVGLTNFVVKVQRSALRTLTWYYYKNTPTFRNQAAIKNACIREQIEKALAKRIKSVEVGDDTWVRNAVDYIIGKEYKLAAKENRKPSYFSQMISSELYSIIVAGHDTTNATLCWGIKLLSDHQDIQTRLRQHLQTKLSSAFSEGRLPTAEEITKTSMPYLDAVMEEIFRVGATISLGGREAIRDTELLGHHIPKGTLVWTLNRGPGFLLPSLDVDASLRSKTALQDIKMGKTPNWSDDDVSEFKPQRWLVDKKSEDADAPSEPVFNINAGPSNSFGMGIRSCAGRKLAYVQFKILLAVLVWNIELQECPEELSGYTGIIGITNQPRQCFVRPKGVAEFVRI